MSTVTESDSFLPKSSFRPRSLLVAQLKRGLHPREFALAIALGATLGVMPLVWGTSFLCVFFASRLHLNQGVVQVTNYLVYPLQIALFVPFLILGDQFFATTLLPLNTSQLLVQISTEPSIFFTQFWQANVQALAIWLLSAPLFGGCLYYLTHLFLKRFRLASDR